MVCQAIQIQYSIRNLHRWIHTIDIKCKSLIHKIANKEFM